MSDEFWERAAQQDPLWAILSDPTKRNRGWDVPSFFEHGRREIDQLLRRLTVLRRMPPRRRAIDFGCGVGRLTQALATSFDAVVGIDASPTMIRLANQLNQCGDRVRYVLNSAPRLEGIPTGSIDLVYTDIVLQHLEPARAMGYVAEFIRVLAPDGVAVFQLPSRKRTPVILPDHPLTMPSGAYRANLTVLAPPPATMESGATAVVRIGIANDSGLTWDQGRHGMIRLGNHWKRMNGETIVQDDGRTALPADMSKPLTLPLDVRAPSEAGSYVCEFDLVHEGISWFADRGSPVQRVPVSVAPGDASPGRRHAAPGQYRVADIGDLLPAPDGTPIGAFPMFGVSRAIVEELVRTAGGVIFHVDDDERAGPEWESHTYFVAKRR